MKYIACILFLFLCAGLHAEDYLGMGPTPAATAIYAGGAVPSSTQVVYSDGTTLAGDAGLTYVAASDALTVAGSVTDGGLTTGRVVWASTGGLLSSTAGFTFNGTTFTTPNITNSSLTATRIPYASTAGLMVDDSGFTRASLALTVDSGSDALLTVGNACMGLAAGGTAGNAYWFQRGIVNPQTNYIIQQSGTTSIVNTGASGSLLLRISNSTKATLNGSSFTLASGVPFTDSDTTDALSAATGSIIGAGGVSAAKNIIAGHNIAQGVATTVTAAATTTLTNASVGVQIFTGSTTQTVQLPLANIFGAGISVQFTAINRSSGSVSWARAGSDTINGATSNVAVTTNTVGMIWSDGVSAWYTK